MPDDSQSKLPQPTVTVTIGDRSETAALDRLPWTVATMIQELLDREHHRASMIDTTRPDDAPGVTRSAPNPDYRPGPPPLAITMAGFGLVTTYEQLGDALARCSGWLDSKSPDPDERQADRVTAAVDFLSRALASYSRAERQAIMGGLAEDYCRDCGAYQGDHPCDCTRDDRGFKMGILCCRAIADCRARHHATTALKTPVIACVKQHLRAPAAARQDSSFSVTCRPICCFSRIGSTGRLSP